MLWSNVVSNVVEQCCGAMLWSLPEVFGGKCLLAGLGLGGRWSEWRAGAGAARGWGSDQCRPHPGASVSLVCTWSAPRSSITGASLRASRARHTARACRTYLSRSASGQPVRGARDEEATRDAGVTRVTITVIVVTTVSSHSCCQGSPPISELVLP